MASFEDLARLDPSRAATLAEAVAAQHMLHEVVAWMATQGPDTELARIVDQDEFTNDVIVRLADVWLVYDCS
jgi:hypothetical protein